MNDEDFDFFRSLKKKPASTSSAADLLKGFNDRKYGYFKPNIKAKEHIELYAEEELVRKQTYNEMRCDMPGHPRSTFLMVFSPDGSKVASTHGNHNIYVTDIRSGKHIKTLVGHPRTPWCIAFHPSSNQIVASGCLGGHVRIWDLSGGSEVWTAGTQSVIASIAFHPNDRVLAIATYNEVYFWDWSKPEPFVHCATSNPREKVRYVAFDKLGHKLITGIANSPQTRWERVRAPVPVPRQAERCASPYRRRITPRLVNLHTSQHNSPEPAGSSTPREGLVGIPERERRITECYRNLVREYEQLVQRYLQLYRPPQMIDRGTDPMEPNPSSMTSGTQTLRPSTSNSTESVQPSTSTEAPSCSKTQEPQSGTSASATSASQADTTNVQYGTTRENCCIKLLSVPCCSIDYHTNQNLSTSYTQTLKPSASSSSEVGASSSSNDSQFTCCRDPMTFTCCTKQSNERPESSTPGPDKFCRKHTVNSCCNRIKKSSQSDSASKPLEESSSQQDETGGSQQVPLQTESSSHCLISPSKIFSMKRPSACKSTHTNTESSRKHKKESEEKEDEKSDVKRHKVETSSSGTSTTDPEPSTSTVQESIVPNINSPMRMVLFDSEPIDSTNNQVEPDQETSSTSKTNSGAKNVIQSFLKDIPIPAVFGKTPYSHQNDSNSSFSTDSSESNQEPLSTVTTTSICTPTDSSCTFASMCSTPVESSSMFASSITPDSNSSTPTESANLFSSINITQDATPRRTLILNTNTMSTPEPPQNLDVPGTSRDGAGGETRNIDELLLSSIRRTAEQEVRNRILPIIRSVPETDRPELIRLFENSREHVRMRFKQMYPKKPTKPPNRRTLFTNNTSSDNSSSEEEGTTQASRLVKRLHNRLDRFRYQGSNTSERIVNADTDEPIDVGTNPVPRPEAPGPSGDTSNRVRNFNTELEQLVTSLLTEIEANDNLLNNNTNSSTPRTENNEETTAETQRDILRNSLPRRSESSSSALTPEWYRSLRDNMETLTREYGVRCSNTNFFAINPNNQSITPFTISTTASTPVAITTTSTTSRVSQSQSAPAASTTTAPSATSTGTSSTRTTNSASYTSNSAPRRRFFLHRVSAFMPTRVNYTRTPSRLRRISQHAWNRGRLSCRQFNNNNGTFALDELINYSERANSEDDPPTTSNTPPPHPESPIRDFTENSRIGSMYSNIVQDLESSLNDVRNIRASNRPGETSDMLSSFSERLENIMTQSDTILRNLRSSMEMLSNSTEQMTGASTSGMPQASSEPSWSFFDQNFYVRDQRQEQPTQESPGSDFTDLLNNSREFNAVATDHTYPRTSESPQVSSSSDNMSPLMTSLHITITHIQRQARLLRQQVENIERIDRSMIEVAQIQLMRQLIIELIQHVPPSNENPSTGITSVRQMMAGTRISDPNPYEPPAESAATRLANSEASSSNSTSSSPSNPPAEASQPGPSGTQAHQTQTGRPRGSNRKTYPPSRIFRLQRQSNRRPSLVHYLSRRYLNRGERGTGRPAPSHNRFNSLSYQSFSNYSVINSSTLNLMTRRLEHLLNEQMRFFTRVDPPVRVSSTNTIDLGEHILALRLHGCVLRVNRIFRRALYADPTAAVTQDGVPRYGARHTLSLIVDGMSRHMEEIGSEQMSQTLRLEIHGVLAMSLLLSELLLLQVIDGIPPPTGLNLDPERESLTTRIDQMCGQMLRFSGHSHQLTRSLRLMRLTMRHAYRALGQTYNARRNAMLIRPDMDRRQLLGFVNRFLRINRNNHNTRRRRNSPGNIPDEMPPDPVPFRLDGTNDPVEEPITPVQQNEGQESSALRDWYDTLTQLFSRYQESPDDDAPAPDEPSTSTGIYNRDRNSSNEDEDEEPEWYSNNNQPSNSSNLYRTNNVNLVNQNSRPWNVPSVQVNDVPVSDQPSMFFERLVSQRQRFAERVSELRHNPSIGMFRPRFLHPLYASVNPFDADLDDPQREQIYDSDMITTVTPNHRIQAWDISNWNVPAISNSLKNLVVSECKIHNDASVDVAKDGTILVTLLPSGGYLNVTNRLGVYSLRWETLGQCLYTTSFEQNAVSVSLSPLSRHLVVGLASRRVSIVSSDRWIMARIFKIEQKDVPGDKLPVLRELEQNRESRINCIRWLPFSGQGLIYATNTGQLIVLS